MNSDTIVHIVPATEQVSASAIQHSTSLYRNFTTGICLRTLHDHLRASGRNPQEASAMVINYLTGRHGVMQIDYENGVAPAMLRSLAIAYPNSCQMDAMVTVVKLGLLRATDNEPARVAIALLESRSAVHAVRLSWEQAKTVAEGLAVRYLCAETNVVKSARIKTDWQYNAPPVTPLRLCPGLVDRIAGMLERTPLRHPLHGLLEPVLLGHGRERVAPNHETHTGHGMHHVGYLGVAPTTADIRRWTEQGLVERDIVSYAAHADHLSISQQIQCLRKTEPKIGLRLIERVVQMADPQGIPDLPAAYGGDQMDYLAQLAPLAWSRGTRRAQSCVLRSMLECMTKASGPGPDLLEPSRDLLARVLVAPDMSGEQAAMVLSLVHRGLEIGWWTTADVAAAMPQERRQQLCGRALSARARFPLKLLQPEDDEWLVPMAIRENQGVIVAECAGRHPEARAWCLARLEEGIVPRAWNDVTPALIGADVAERLLALAPEIQMTESWVELAVAQEPEARRDLVVAGLAAFAATARASAAYLPPQRETHLAGKLLSCCTTDAVAARALAESLPDLLLWLCDDDPVGEAKVLGAQLLAGQGGTTAAHRISTTDNPSVLGPLAAAVRIARGLDPQPPGTMECMVALMHVAANGPDEGMRTEALLGVVGDPAHSAPEMPVLDP